MAYYPKKGFIPLGTLWGLILAVAIGFFLLYKILNIYTKRVNIYYKKSPFGRKRKEFLLEKDINTGNSESVLESTRKKIKKVNKQILDRQRELEDFGQSR